MKKKFNLCVACILTVTYDSIYHDRTLKFKTGTFKFELIVCIVKLWNIKHQNRLKVLHKLHHSTYTQVALHRFEIPLPSICNLCPDLKSLKVPLFVIPLAPTCNPKNPAPICNRLIVPFCNPENVFLFPLFPHFGIGIWAWITLIRIWWNLVWDIYGMIPRNNLGFNKFNRSHW